MTATALPVPTDLGTPEHTLRQGGRGFLFIQVMFLLPIVAAARSLVMHRGLDLIAPIALASVGILGILAVHSVARLRLKAAELHPVGLVTRRGSGNRLWQYAQVQAIRSDSGQELRPAYLVIVEGDLQLRLNPPRTGEEEALEVFVRALATRAGLRWDGRHATR